MPDRPEAGGARALAWIYSPAAQRRLLGPLLGIEREIGGSLRAGLDHEIAHTRLAWWREECERTVAGRPSHPLTREVAGELGAATAAALAALGGLVDLATWDLARATFATRAELTAYCERWSAALLAPLARGTAAAAVLRGLGAALRETELLLSLPADAQAGRLRLPLDELEPLGVSAAQIARPPWPAPVAESLRARHAELRSTLAASVAALAPQSQPALRGVVVWAALTAQHSARAARRLPHARLAREHREALDGWRAWRVARRATTGRGCPPAC
ncbi:MAG: squalene/phytoene synthase family protein [Gammaproteobacteria bacterium]|nr:squalene/phytoene synthase family protein [Gammaproteobacteria bacterium]